MMWPLNWKRRGLVRLGFERSAGSKSIPAKLETRRTSPRRHKATATEFLKLL